MYSTCLFCHTDLGANAVVEQFPVGRRLAFDATKGRLWVVCGKCERWNLTPIEERWEAIECCERLFRATRLRLSTDNIGLARVREGLELVRIGSALRPEMAAWRYGDQFGRRRRRFVTTTAAAVIVGTAGVVMIGGPLTGMLGTVVGASTVLNLGNLSQMLHVLRRARTVRARVVLPGHDRPFVVRQAQLAGTAIESLGDQWKLHLRYDATGTRPFTTDDSVRGSWYQNPWKWTSAQKATIALSGQDAIRAAGQILPIINRTGAGKKGIERAVEVVELTPDAEKLFGRVIGPGRRPGVTVPAISVPGSYYGRQLLGSLPPHIRLALEMVAHEDTERRALEGELALLEAAWRDAEDIAAISDAMFTPADVEARFDAMKRPPETPG